MKNIIIIKSDGTPTGCMDQATAETYLGHLIEPNRMSNLKQSLNDVTGGAGKSTAPYAFEGNSVMHASSGIPGVKSVCLFYYESGANHCIIAMGEHLPTPKGASPQYLISDYGQPSGDFKKGKKIVL